MLKRQTKGQAHQAFLLGLAVAAAMFLPFVIMDGGYFIYYGDFNVQQIPFYRLAHEAVRSGGVLWNWHTDLGANFIGSYSFYLLFSPFFWLTLPFPATWLPFLMAPLLALKTACAAFTSYFYLERFVRDKSYAVLGSLLYAFSGWMFFNIFFNHFHEVAVFFPLLLLGVEQLVNDDKKALFAVAVTINAMVNYWFFVGEAVFVALYVFVRMTDRDFRMSAAKFLRLACEAVLGTGMAALVLVPSVMALTGNPRTGLSELVTGWNAWLYWHEQRQPAILQSLLFPPELPARPNFFPDHGAKWASLSAWLPMISLVGVLAYFFSRKNDWLKNILAISLLCALVPGLNSLFILLNNSYYARWFYMPVLLMSLASVRAIEDSAHGAVYLKRGAKWVFILIAVFGLMCGVTPDYGDDGLVFGLAKDLPLLAAYVAVALIGLALTLIAVVYFRYHKHFKRIMIASVAAFSFAFAVFYMGVGKSIFERSDFVINTAIKGREQISLPQEPFARADAFDAQDNLLMFWGLPNIQAFHSIVPASIMEFYPKVGVKRDVGSRPEAEFFALRPLLSVRWLFIEKDHENQSPIPGFTKYAEQAGFNIYENDNFIPMGFAYDKCITPHQLEDVETDERSNMMLKAVTLEDDAIARNTDILEHISVNGIESFSFRAMENDAAARNAYTADSFAVDTRGFSAYTNFDRPRLVFFSVPWGKGWTAEIYGSPVQIERANIGFMAVRVPAGDCTVRFNYFTPGLIEGILISGTCVFIFALYALVAFIRFRREKAGEPDFVTAVMNGIPVEMSREEYLERFGDKRARRSRLQRALNEASAKQMPEMLADDEITFQFSIDGANNGNNKVNGPKSALEREEPPLE